MLLFKPHSGWICCTTQSQTWCLAHPPVRILFCCIFIQLLAKWTLINIIDEGKTELKIDIFHRPTGLIALLCKSQCSKKKAENISQKYLGVRNKNDWMLWLNTRLSALAICSIWPHVFSKTPDRKWRIKETLFFSAFSRVSKHHLVVTLICQRNMKCIRAVPIQTLSCNAKSRGTSLHSAAYKRLFVICLRTVLRT